MVAHALSNLLLTTLERMLKGEVETVFQETRFLVTSDEIRLELAALQHRVEIGQAIDYTDQLPQPEPSVQMTEPANEVISAASAPGISMSAAQAASVWPTTPQGRASGAGARVSSTGEVISLYHYGRTQAAVYGKESAPRAKRRVNKD